MRIIKTILLVISIFVITLKLSITANAANIDKPSNFLTIQKQLSKTKNIQGKFTQERVIKVLTNPLISSGHFSLSKTKGLKWIQEKPFSSTLTLNSSVLTQTIANNPPMILTKAKQPFVFSFSKIFLSIFNGDQNTLKQSFNIKLNGNIENWNMILTPKSSPLDKAIKFVNLKGGKTIDQVIVKNVKNDQLIIKFYDIKLK